MAINGLEAIIFPNGPSLSSYSLRLRDQFNVQTTCKEHQQNFDDGWFHRASFQSRICIEKKIYSHYIYYINTLLLYVNINQGIHKGKNKVAPNEKWKKRLWVFVHIKYLCQIFRRFARSFHQPLISEKCNFKM